MSVCVLGSINADTVFQVDALVRAGETITATSMATHAGGKGANQAVAAAKIGAAARLVAMVGRDPVGAGLKGFLKSAGVDVSSVTECDVPTGAAFICVDRQGENTIVVSSGANAALSQADMGFASRGEDRVFLSQLETDVTTVAAFFRRPDARPVVKILNAAPFVEDARALFCEVDLIIVNEPELAAYAKLGGGVVERATLLEAAQSIVQTTDQSVVITLGAAGAALFSGGRIQMIEGRRVEVVDTTGAGDCFCGVLAALLDEGRPLEDAVRFANYAAAVAVTRRGASAMPTRLEVEAFANAEMAV
jgi:ribokinase